MERFMFMGRVRRVTVTLSLESSGLDQTEIYDTHRRDRFFSQILLFFNDAVVSGSLDSVHVVTYAFSMHYHSLQNDTEQQSGPLQSRCHFSSLVVKSCPLYKPTLIENNSTEFIIAFRIQHSSLHAKRSIITIKYTCITTYRNTVSAECIPRISVLFL